MIAVIVSFVVGAIAGSVTTVLVLRKNKNIQSKLNNVVTAASAVAAK